jgi:hypothetical protein
MDFSLWRYRSTCCLFTLLLLNTIFSTQAMARDPILIEPIDEPVPIKPSSVEVINDRLYFADLQALNSFFDNHADDDEDELFTLLESEYTKGFFSLRPPVTEFNEDYIYNKLNTSYAGKTPWTADAVNSTEEVIGHDTFAALLNVDGEIQVGTQIYKYTDAGLFSVPETKYTELESYLSQKEISKSLLIPTNKLTRQQFLSDEQVAAKSGSSKEGNIVFYGAYPKCDWAKGDCGDGGDPLDSESTSLAKDTSILSLEQSSIAKLRELDYSTDLIAPINCDIRESDLPHLSPVDDECSGGGGGGGGGSGGGSGGTTTDPMAGLESFVNNLQPCSPSSGIFGNIFGVNKVCIDRYESKKRVKTKAFNYDYFIVYHTGIKVKHQKKGWTGLWRKQDTTAVALGGKKIQFTYDVTSVLAGALAGLNFNESKITARSLGQQWTLDLNFYTNPYGYTGVTSTTNYSSSLYPTVFQDDLIIETHGDNAVLDWLIAQGEKQATADKLNEYFWGNLRNGVKSAVGSITFNPNYQPPINTTLAYKNAEYGKILVQKSYFRSCLNCKKIDKTLDFGFLLSLDLNPEDNWDISGSVETGLILKPKDYSVTLYGAAKRDGVWHGSLIDF